MKDDGGPAFPMPIGWNGLSHYEEHKSNQEQAGMSLRDYIAIRATEQDILEHSYDEIHAVSGVPKVIRNREQARYHFADAMLKERQK